MICLVHEDEKRKEKRREKEKRKQKKKKMMTQHYDIIKYDIQILTFVMKLF